MQESQVSAIAHVIQLAVAPVFLLTGVGAMLGVMASRLARVIDRARVLEDRLAGATPERELRYRSEMKTLARRGSLMQRAIGLCTTSALLALFTGLVMFLAEIRLAITGMRIAPH